MVAGNANFLASKKASRLIPLTSRPPEEARAIRAKGGRGTKGISKKPYLKCNECTVRSECEFFKADSRCAIEVELRRNILKKPAEAFIELGFATPQKFFERIARDIVDLRQSIRDRGDHPKQLMGYIDRMLGMAKLLYGEKHLNINVNVDNEDKMLKIETLLGDARKELSYQPNQTIVDVEYEVKDTTPTINDPPITINDPPKEDNND